MAVTVYVFNELLCTCAMTVTVYVCNDNYCVYVKWQLLCMFAMTTAKQPKEKCLKWTQTWQYVDTLIFQIFQLKFQGAL